MISSHFYETCLYIFSQPLFLLFYKATCFLVNEITVREIPPSTTFSFILCLSFPLITQGALSWHELALCSCALLYRSTPLRFHFQGSTSPLSKLEVNCYPSLISDFLVKYKLSSIHETTTFKLLLSTPQPPRVPFKFIIFFEEHQTSSL